MPQHQKDSRAGVEFISEMRAWKGTRAGIAVVRFGGRSRSPDGERVEATLDRTHILGGVCVAPKNNLRRTALSEERGGGVYLLYSLGARVRFVSLNRWMDALGVCAPLRFY